MKLGHKESIIFSAPLWDNSETPVVGQRIDPTRQAAARNIERIFGNLELYPENRFQ